MARLHGYLQVNMTRVFVLLIAGLTACRPTVTPTASITPTIEQELFKGHFILSLEVASFVPCGMGKTPGSGQGFWLIPNEEFSEQYRNASSIVAGTFGPNDQIASDWYAEFYGVLSPPAEAGAGYGHLGAYTRTVTVTQAIQVTYYQVGSDPCAR